MLHPTEWHNVRQASHIVIDIYKKNISNITNDDKGTEKVNGGGSVVMSHVHSIVLQGGALIDTEMTWLKTYGASTESISKLEMFAVPIGKGYNNTDYNTDNKNDDKKSEFEMQRLMVGVVIPCSKKDARMKKSELNDDGMVRSVGGGNVSILVFEWFMKTET